MTSLSTKSAGASEQKTTNTELSTEDLAERNLVVQVRDMTILSLQAVAKLTQLHQSSPATNGSLNKVSVPMSFPS